jgi:Leucine-rich repeat (LRR) protein
VFADPLVELAVREQAQVPKGPIPRAAGEQVPELLLVDERVTDLGGLGCLVNLEQLGIRYGEVTSLAPLRGLQRLKKLETTKLPITSLVGLEESPLEWMEISDSEVEDLSPLSAVKTLQSLSVRRSPVGDLGPLSPLTAMFSLAKAMAFRDLSTDCDQCSACEIETISWPALH